MPQGPGTYGTQKGRPKKKDKMVDPKKKEQTSNVAPPPAPQQQPPAPQQQTPAPAEEAMKSITQHKPDPASQGGVRWETPGGQVGWSANQERADAQAKRFGATEQDSVIAKDNIAKEEAEIEAEVAKRMTPEGQQQQRQQLEQEGFLEKGSADRMRRSQKELEAEQKPPTDKTPFLDAVENPSSAPGAENWGGVDTVGMMEAERQAEMRRKTGMNTWLDNQKYEEEQAQARQKQEEADAKVMDERMAALEDKKYQKYMADKEEYEISGFDGSMKEWEQDRSNRARYQRGVDDLSIDRDMSFEDWEAQDYADRRAKKQARDARLEEERGVRRQEKEERRVSERERHLGERDALRSRVEARREARNRGLERGTEEYQQFMNRETSGGIEAQRAHELAIEKAKSGDTEAVAEQTTEQVETTTEGQITLQGMVGEQTLAQLKQQGVNEQALQELVNDGVDLTNKSAEEIQRIISEREIKTQEIQTGGEVTIATGEWKNRLDMAESVEDLEKLRLESAERINTANNEISRHQIDVGERLANEQLSFDAFSKELDTMLKLSNNSLEAITQFAVTNGQFMTPQMQQAMVAQILSMDEGAELARTVQSFYNKGTNLLGQDPAKVEEIEKVEQQEQDEAKLTDQTRINSGVTFTDNTTLNMSASEMSEQWTTLVDTATGGKGKGKGWIEGLSDIGSRGTFGLYLKESDKQRHLTDLNNAEEMRQFLLALPEDDMKKMAKGILDNTNIRGKLGGFDIGGIREGGEFENAADGLLQMMERLSRGDKTLPTELNDAYVYFGIGAYGKGP